MAHAQQQGYHVAVNFLYLPRVELNLARIVHRVSQGGHSVAEVRGAAPLPTRHRPDPRPAPGRRLFPAH